MIDYDRDEACPYGPSDELKTKLVFGYNLRMILRVCEDKGLNKYY